LIGQTRQFREGDDLRRAASPWDEPGWRSISKTTPITSQSKYCSYDATARGRIVGDASGFLKLIFRRSDMRLLGVHVLGEQATELVQIGLVAMLRSSTSEVFSEACFNIPTFGELYKFAAIDAEKAAAEDARSWYPPG
jgi:hypothetical protein